MGIKIRRREEIFGRLFGGIRAPDAVFRSTDLLLETERSSL